MELVEVTIKTWDDMLREYGLADSGTSIAVKHIFTRDMERALPKGRVIPVTPYFDVYKWDVGGCKYTISNDMIVNNKVEVIKAVEVNEVDKLKLALSNVNNILNDIYLHTTEDMYYTLRLEVTRALKGNTKKYI